MIILVVQIILSLLFRKTLKAKKKEKKNLLIIYGDQKDDNIVKNSVIKAEMIGVEVKPDEGPMFFMLALISNGLIRHHVPLRRALEVW